MNEFEEKVINRQKLYEEVTEFLAQLKARFKRIENSDVTTPEGKESKDQHMKSLKEQIDRQTGVVRATLGHLEVETMDYFANVDLPVEPEQVVKVNLSEANNKWNKHALEISKDRR
ncbi:MAG: hypothetical protein Q7K26_05330 [bacterium]|nr:hypothetical protein [bacterium]